MALKRECSTLIGIFISRCRGKSEQAQRPGSHTMNWAAAAMNREQKLAANAPCRSNQKPQPGEW